MNRMLPLGGCGLPSSRYLFNLNFCPEAPAGMQHRVDVRAPRLRGWTGQTGARDNKNFGGL